MAGVKLDLNGKQFPIGLPGLIAVLGLVVTLAVTLSQKVDRDEVSACEARIITLENGAEQRAADVAEIKDLIETLRSQNSEILSKVIRIEERQAPRRNGG